MDGFGDNIDLDKLLDDFERSEGNRLAANTLGVKLSDGTGANNEFRIATPPNTTANQSAWQNSPETGVDDGGYFVPEVTTNVSSDDDGYDCTDGRFIVDGSDAFSSLASDTYISDGVLFRGCQPAEVPPELLHNADFGLGDVTSRPSFLSSSPPQITSHPDIVPTRMSVNDAGTPDAVPDVHHMTSDEQRDEPPSSPDMRTDIPSGLFGDDSDATTMTNHLNSLSFASNGPLHRSPPPADVTSCSSSASSLPRNASCSGTADAVASVDSGVAADVVSSPHLDVIPADDINHVEEISGTVAGNGVTIECTQDAVAENGADKADGHAEVGFGDIGQDLAMTEDEMCSYLADVHQSVDYNAAEVTSDRFACSDVTVDQVSDIANVETDAMVDEIVDSNDIVSDVSNRETEMTHCMPTHTVLHSTDADVQKENTDDEVLAKPSQYNSAEVPTNGDSSPRSLLDELSSAVSLTQPELTADNSNATDVIDERLSDVSCTRTAPFTQGARPKQRPNSLLGLSMPFVSPPKTCTETIATDTKPVNVEVQNTGVLEDGSTVANPRPCSLNLPARGADCTDGIQPTADTDYTDGIQTARDALEDGSTMTNPRPCSLDLPARGTDCADGIHPTSADSLENVTPVTDLSASAAAAAAGDDGGASDALAQLVPAADPQAIASDYSLRDTVVAAAAASSAVAEHSPPRSSVNPDVSITQLGKMAPVWLPDSETTVCMQCEAKFTFTKRRHHCRSCGKIFCSACCSLKSQLEYLEMREARVCSRCYQDIIRAQVYTRMHAARLDPPPPPSRPPDPSRPSEYCSTIPPQASACPPAQPPTVMVPVGVLRRQAAAERRGESKQVMFSDGIRPGGDLTELDGSAQLPAPRTGRKTKKVEKSGGGKSSGKTKVKTLKSSEEKQTCFIPAEGLPPVLVSNGSSAETTMQENPVEEEVMAKLRAAGEVEPVVFVLNKNLSVLVKIVTLDCCVNRECWNMCTRGMSSVAQEEMVVVLECLPDEKTVPVDVLKHFSNVYHDASKGDTVSSLDHSLLTQPTLGSKDHCGWLYVRPNFQCVQKLLLPPPPYVVAILLQKWETPWAKVFPIRLMLRLGAQYRYYPCPLVSVRFRKPVFGEIGHTIMNLLADFRNYQFTLTCVRGVRVHMQDQRTSVQLPRNRYNEVMKMVSNSNDCVMAFGATFSTDADSHLVCIQNEDGNYETQAINIQNKPRKITGASFIVFNGALKSSSGLHAKSSIVEDGVMVQISGDTLAELRQRLQDMQDYSIACGSVTDGQTQPSEYVVVEWVNDDKEVNVGVTSPIDGRAMDGVNSVHIHNATDYAGDHLSFRWTHVFFISSDDGGGADPPGANEPVDLSRLAETLAHAFCIALTPHLDALNAACMQCFGLRATIDSDMVGYEVGSNGVKLPADYMNSLDNELIPVIHNAATFSRQGSVILELIFHIIH